MYSDAAEHDVPIPSLQPSTPLRNSANTYANADGIDRKRQPLRRERNPRRTAPEPPRVPAPDNLPTTSDLVPVGPQSHHGLHALGRHVPFRRRVSRLPSLWMAPGVREPGGRVRDVARHSEG